MYGHLGEKDIFALTARRLLAHEQKVQRKASVKRIGVLNLLDIFSRQFERERSDVTVKLLHCTPTNDRVDVRALVEDVGQAKVYSISTRRASTMVSKGISDLRNRSQSRLLLQRQLLENLADRDICFRYFEQFPPLAALLLAPSLESPTSNDAPWSDSHPFSLAHGDDFPLKIPARSTPAALVHDERPQAVIASVLVRFCDQPGWSVGDAEVEDFALVGESIEAVHDFFDRCGVVPPVHVELLETISHNCDLGQGRPSNWTDDVNVTRPQPLQTALDAGEHRLGAVAGVIALDRFRVLAGVEARRELHSRNRSVCITSTHKPTPEPDHTFVATTISSLEPLLSIHSPSQASLSPSW